MSSWLASKNYWLRSALNPHSHFTRKAQLSDDLLILAGYMSTPSCGSNRRKALDWLPIKVRKVRLQQQVPGALARSPSALDWVDTCVGSQSPGQ